MMSKHEFKEVYNVLYTLDIIPETDDDTVEKVYTMALNALNDVFGKEYEEISVDEAFMAIKMGTDDLWKELIAHVERPKGE